MVELKNVNVFYKDSGIDALRDVNIRINDGEFVFIVGDSGAGKSTLLKLFTNEMAPTSGRVFVNGYNLAKLKKRQIPRFRRSIGMVFQDFRLIPNLTVFENVAFVLRVIDKSKRFIRQRVPMFLIWLNWQTAQNPTRHSFPAENGREWALRGLLLPTRD